MSASIPASLPLPPERMMTVLRSLQRVAGAAARPAEAGRLFRALAEALGGVVGGAATTATVDEGALRLRAGTGAFASMEGERLPIQASLAGAAFTRGAMRMTADVGGDADALLLERELPAGAYLAAPLVVDGTVVGVVLAARAAGEPPFGAEDAAALELVMPAVAEAVAGAQGLEARRRSRAAQGAWRTERQLREEVARLRGALWVGGVVAFQLDPSTGSTMWTGDVEAAFGFAAAGPGSRLDGWIGRVHPADRTRLADALGVDDRTPRRLRIRMADRKQAPRLFHVFVVPTRRGRPGALLCVMREAEPPMVREVEVVREVPIAAHDPAMLTTVIRAVRHELGVPLSVIAAEAQRLEGEWIVQAESALERPVQAIAAAAHRLGALAERLAAIEADPDALVITGEGAVALHGDAAETESTAAAAVA